MANALTRSTATLASLRSRVLVASAADATLGVPGAVLVPSAWILTVRRTVLGTAPISPG